LASPESRPMAGMKSVVEYLVVAGLKLGIVTSTPSEHMGFKMDKLKRNDALGHFGAIVDALSREFPDAVIGSVAELGTLID